MTSLTTSRLILRPWTDADREPFAAINADPKVCEFLGDPLSRTESDALADRIEQDLKHRGWGFWAAGLQNGAPFVGFVGLSVPNFDAPFMPCVEVGWRLASEHWGQGYATEGARAAVKYGFMMAHLDEVVAYTAVGNKRSRNVMRRVGMSRDPGEDFDHPYFSSTHPLRRHVLYRVRRPR